MRWALGASLAVHVALACLLFGTQARRTEVRPGTLPDVVEVSFEVEKVPGEPAKSLLPPEGNAAPADFIARGENVLLRGDASFWLTGSPVCDRVLVYSLRLFPSSRGRSRSGRGRKGSIREPRRGETRCSWLTEMPRLVAVWFTA